VRSTLGRAGLDERQAPGKVVTARTPKRLAQSVPPNDHDCAKTK